jgi:predicted dehydrogenase
MSNRRMSVGTTLNRRQMLRQSALAGIGVWTAASSWGGEASRSPNEKLNIAGIGVGGQGGWDIAQCTSENIVALCDVDDRRAAGSFGRFPQAKRYRDFRKMLDEMDKQIDAVVVGTPDHTHAAPSVMAMNMGKHCYCEKPLAHCVDEVRAMIEAAQKNKVATQMGTQIHAGANYRRVVELVQSGAIGPVGEVHVWHPVAYGGGDRPTDTPAVPAELDWDLWLGPAPSRPYHPCYLPGTWRSWRDFGTGGLGDFGCHYMDLPFWALQLQHPLSIESEGPAIHPERTSPGLTVRYAFPARGDLPPVNMTWYDGGKRPAFLAERKIPEWGAAVLFIGQKGMLIADYGKHQLLPEAEFADFQRPAPTIPDSIGHHAEWIRACKTGEPTTCNFNYSGALAEAVMLGNVSYYVGRKLDWDAANMTCADCPQADALLRKEYRSGWSYR